mmetsp:Transcript_16842/g.48560  ORF Transcript_16842/g.48560 Transcript_16842/m.48560 type:complete len:210 (-) Transcript_16842:591-1220(-)
MSPCSSLRRRPFFEILTALLRPWPSSRPSGPRSDRRSQPRRGWRRRLPRSGGRPRSGRSGAARADDGYGQRRGWRMSLRTRQFGCSPIDDRRRCRCRRRTPRSRSPPTRRWRGLRRVQPPHPRGGSTAASQRECRSGSTATSNWSFPESLRRRRDWVWLARLGIAPPPFPADATRSFASLARWGMPPPMVRLFAPPPPRGGGSEAPTTT